MTVPAARLLVLLCVVCSWTTSVQAAPARPLASAIGDEPRPNVLIVLADDLGVDQLIAYGVGSDHPVTPNMDALSAEGVTFTRAWSTPVCSPARACIMTGRLPWRTRIGDIMRVGGAELSPAEVILPEALDAAQSGYAHALVGKWHLSSTPAATVTAPLEAGYSHWSGTVGPLRDYYDWQHSVNGVVSTSTRYATSVQVDEALAWIDAQEQPWLCFLGVHSPHSPYQAPPAGTYTEDLTGLDPSVHQRQFYKAMVENLDFELGRLLAGLGDRLDDTLVLFLGDNGTPSVAIPPPLDPTHDKGTLYEGGVRVPLIASGAGVDRRGTTSARPVHVVDVFATVLQAAGAEPPPVPLDSRSFLDVLASGPPRAPIDSTQAVAPSLYTEWFTPNGAGPPTSCGRALRNDRFKLLWQDGTEQLFDLLLDPHEATNLLLDTLDDEALTNYLRLAAELNRRSGC